MDKVFAAYKDGWVRIVDFAGKSTRLQFWSFALINIVISAVISAVFKLIGVDSVMWIVNIVFLIAGLANDFRRLHDTKRSAWNLLWVLLPIIGWIILLVYFLQPSKK